jgi:hypothetical protein
MFGTLRQVDPDLLPLFNVNTAEDPGTHVKRCGGVATLAGCFPRPA